MTCLPFPPLFRRHAAGTPPIGKEREAISIRHLSFSYRRRREWQVGAFKPKTGLSRQQSAGNPPPRARAVGNGDRGNRQRVHDRDRRHPHVRDHQQAGQYHQRQQATTTSRPAAPALPCTSSHPSTQPSSSSQGHQSTQGTSSRGQASRQQGSGGLGDPPLGRGFPTKLHRKARNHGAPPHSFSQN